GHGRPGGSDYHRSGRSRGGWDRRGGAPCRSRRRPGPEDQQGLHLCDTRGEGDYRLASVATACLASRQRRGPCGESFMTPAVDLASRWLGASVMSASDESFGDKENLLKPSPAFFEPGHYGNRGEIVDGWETRRRREGGHDWAIIRLGAPGIVTSVDVDTSF